MMEEWIHKRRNNERKEWRHNGKVKKEMNEQMKEKKQGMIEEGRKKGMNKLKW